ncbi:MAG: PaaI family thioesterase [Rhodospirillaceae bacterium]|nr:PaaI family thioesterase [Rhodospirillaceae bacterium]
MPDPSTMPPPNMEAVLRFYATSPHHQAIGLKVVSADREKAVMRVGYDKRFIGNPDTGALHGGLVTTLMDSTGALAVLAQVPAGTAVATLDLRLDYLRPAIPGQDLIGDSHCFKVTPNLAFSRGTAFEEGNDDDPVANFVATYMLKPVGIGMDTGGDAS